MARTSVISRLRYWDVGSPIASGTYRTRGMAFVPSSMNTVASVAHGLSGNLLLRAADVSLKEGRKLVMVPRRLRYIAFI
ncbi:MAG: hypothetical protein CM1200mP35_10590 [Chloroflexota bacterium]|nr:MAG: hypothetical protein CM1200mP35_10590 [Chloroflexota bacterium]